MTAGGRLAVLGGCTAIGILVAWTIHTPARLDVPSARVGSTSASVGSHPAGAASTPVLWVLALGVSRYHDPQFNLQFADVDARAVAAALQRQAGGPLFREAKTLVLTNEEVTRESILSSMERFLGQAGPEDVVAIFVAGHGVQDGSSGSFYFLPYPATDQNLLTAGLRMSDFDEMVRVVRRNARSVVVMLDTCHAGALRLSASSLLAAEDAGARMSVGEGFFLLAATTPGEDSKEKPELAHGAFTYAVIEGLGGAADADGDGLLTVSDLFGYVAREVPRLTGGSQHPYHKMEGTDLVLAAVRRAPGTAAGTLASVETAGPSAAVAPAANTIGVMEFRDLRADAQHDWIGKAVRVALNTELSKVRALRVYSPDLIDRASGPRRPDHLATAQTLGIRTLLTGSFHVVGTTIRIDAQIVDVASGVQKGSDSVQGNLDDFFDLQKKLVLSMLRRLPVEVSAAEGQSIQNRTNTSVDAYRLLLEAEGVVEEDKPTPSPRAAEPPAGPRSAVETLWRMFAASLRGEADAEEPDSAVVTEVRRFLEEYRHALEHKDLDRLAGLYVSFSARQRDATRAYLDGAGNLAVALTDVTIEPHGPDVAVTFTRRDRFIDRESGKDTPVEVRLTKILVRAGGTWRIAR